MHDHHREAIDRLTEHYDADPDVVALLIGGSVAKGWADADSDVDFMLVVSAEALGARTATGTLTVTSEGFTEYPGGYVDGKFVDLGFIREVAARGSEPARSAFDRVIVAFTREPALGPLLDDVVRYPGDVEDRLRSYNAHVQAMRWFASQAEKRGDPYLASYAASNLVLHGGRMILAHNRVLFPFHKWFLHELRRVPEKPDALLEEADALLLAPSPERAERFAETVLSWREWPEPETGWGTRFLAETEWAWRSGPAPPGER